METLGPSIKVIVIGYSDGFEVVLEDQNKTQHRFGFNEEDTHERLVDVFKALGYQARYYQDRSEDCY